MIILGIDPSLRGTGWGILEVQGNQLSSQAFGVIQNPPKLKMSRCLLEIERQLTQVIAKYRPMEVAVEGIFYAQNIKTALVMGQARGAVLLAAASMNLEIFEYAPRKIKQGTVGKGAASKNQVGFMVRALLGLTETPPPDAADALAVAITHAHASQGVGKVESI